MSLRKKIIFWIVAFIISVSILFVNLTYEKWIEKQYAQGNYSILNSLSASSKIQNLGYYTGKIEDVTIGPLRNVLMHLLFACFCLIYLKSLTFKRFWFYTFIFLVLSKFYVLFFPPYGDAIGGPFIEGWWLAKHNFDYISLFHQPGYNFGGPKVYMFSIYPTYIAILLKLIPHTKTFLVVNHLLVYGMAAGIVAILRALILKDYDSKIATLTSIVLLALPIFQSQTEAINMELPYLFFSIISVYFLTFKRMGKALLFAFIATLVKGHGLLNCGLIVFFSLMFFLFEKKEELQKRNFQRGKFLLYAFIASAIALLKVGSKFLLHDQHASAGMIKLFIGWASLKHMRHPYLYMATFMVFLIIVLFKQRMKISLFIQSLLGEYYVRFVIYMSAGMWYLLFLNFYAVSPRYMLGMTPFIIAGVIYVFLLAIPQLSRISAWLLIPILIVTSLNSYGLSHKGQGTTYHVLSERSLQYRNDLKLNMKMAKDIEENYRQYTIGAPFITAQILRIPELGFVDKPLDVMAYGMPVLYAGIKRFEGLQKLSIMNTLWIGMPDQFKTKGDFSYPVNRKDKVVKRLELGDNFTVYFMGGLSIDLAWKYLQLNRMKAYSQGLIK